MASNGILSVSTTPSGASFFIQSSPGGALTYVGKTPINVTKPEGLYKIQISLGGYSTINSMVSIIGGSTKSVSYTLYFPCYVEGKMWACDLTWWWNNVEKRSKIPVGATFDAQVEAGNNTTSNKTSYLKYMFIAYEWDGVTEYWRQSWISTDSRTIEPDDSYMFYVNPLYTLPATVNRGYLYIKFAVGGVSGSTLNPESITCPIDVTPPKSTINVTANVDNSVVYVDGVTVGLAPISNYIVDAGEHTVVVQKEAYDTYYASKNLYPGETWSVTANMVKSTFFKISDIQYVRWTTPSDQFTALAYAANQGDLVGSCRFEFIVTDSSGNMLASAYRYSYDVNPGASAVQNFIHTLPSDILEQSNVQLRVTFKTYHEV